MKKGKCKLKNNIEKMSFAGEDDWHFTYEAGKEYTYELDTKRVFVSTKDDYVIGFSPQQFKSAFQVCR
jgi:hypothetical protein